jgi:hypothetical protein
MSAANDRLWRDLRVETLASPDGSVRTSVYVRLVGNSTAVAMDCDTQSMPEDLAARLTKAESEQSDPAQWQSDPTQWLRDPTFSVGYAPEYHGHMFRIDWTRLVALLHKTCPDDRFVTFEMSRRGMCVSVNLRSATECEVCRDTLCLLFLLAMQLTFLLFCVRPHCL